MFLCHSRQKMDDKKKRKVSFNPDVDLDQTSKKQKKTSDDTGDTRLHSGKYTLDSDEDDEEELEETKQMNKDELNGWFVQMRRDRMKHTRLLLF